MISENISFKEGTFSATATRLGLPNAPNKDHLFNMQMIAKKIFEPMNLQIRKYNNEGITSKII